MASEVETVVIGGGQAGLSVGYHLQRQGAEFLILDAHERTGDQWRRRWDSLRLFTPARFSGLDGMPFPSHPDHFPTKDEFADYLESYARRFALPIRYGARVDRVSREADLFTVEAGESVYLARNVVVAMANYQRPSIPSFSVDLDPDIVQLHSSEYRNANQLPPDGDVLVVGSGNSGAEIALELSRGRRVFIAGRYPGHMPFDVAGPTGRAFLVRFVLKFVFHRVLTVATPIGRKLRTKLISRSGPLIRTKAKHLASAGVERLPRIEGVAHGLPQLADGSTLNVSAVVWCTGYRPGFEWLDLPLQSEGHEPEHRRGLVDEIPGLNFVGLHFLYALSSAMIHGVGRDAERTAGIIAGRALQESETAAPHVAMAKVARP